MSRKCVKFPGDEDWWKGLSICVWAQTSRETCHHSSCTANVENPQTVSNCSATNSSFWELLLLMIKHSSHPDFPMHACLHTPPRLQAYQFSATFKLLLPCEQTQRGRLKSTCIGFKFEKIKHSELAVSLFEESNTSPLETLHWIFPESSPNHLV